MANLRDIRRRIKSVKNTRQITRAMQLVSSSKMKKAQDAAIKGRPYLLVLGEMIKDAAEALNKDKIELENPLFSSRPIRKRGILILSSDKGLCGPLNTNIFRFIVEQEISDAVFFTIGKKAKQFVTRSNLNLQVAYQLKENAELSDVNGIVDELLNTYKEGAIDSIEIVYPNFINVLIQKPAIEKVVPIKNVEKIINNLRKKIKLDNEALIESNQLMIFEPSVAKIFEKLSSLYLRVMVYQLFLEAKASEYSARMVAMKSATDNASKLVDSLTLDYNKARQAAITQEILEIAAASAA